jgi:hypothetical protein
MPLEPKMAYSLQEQVMKNRLDRLSAILINAILTNRPFESIQTIARALAHHGIPLEVAIRVLTRPWERRLFGPGINETTKNNHTYLPERILYEQT